VTTKTRERWPGRYWVEQKLPGGQWLSLRKLKLEHKHQFPEDAERSASEARARYAELEKGHQIRVRGEEPAKSGPRGHITRYSPTYSDERQSLVFEPRCELCDGLLEPELHIRAGHPECIEEDPGQKLGPFEDDDTFGEPVAA